MNIYYPLFIMVILTILVVLRPLYFNISSVLRNEVHIKHFRLFDDGIPPKLQSVSQHYKNMFEMPVLFYLLCVLLIINDNATSFDILFAWGFVLFRILHSISRIPNRDVNLRFGLFAGSFVMLIGGWINFGMKIIF
ncbi:MAG: MAPEG family protein [Candidatus Marinimicrobia bacterium]|nr:MAPEG family protein [Candidatus Neomarinimicrobiota bacterium]